MNPRIFKKLTQRAAKALKAKNHVQYLEEVVQTGEDSGPEITWGFKWELKSYYRKSRELTYGSAWNVRTQVFMVAVLVSGLAGLKRVRHMNELRTRNTQTTVDALDT